MVTKRFSISENGTDVLEISLEISPDLVNVYTILLNKHVIATITGRRLMTKGQEFQLPNDSNLKVQELPNSSWQVAVNGEQVWEQGAARPEPGAASSEQKVATTKPR